MTKRFSGIKDCLSEKTGQFVFWLLLLQPVLDAVSYFANVYSFTVITTAVRMLMFAAVCLYCFIISDRKKIYLIAAGGLALFWVIHMAACFRAGYDGILADAGYFVRTIHLPVLTLCFITCFKKSSELPRRICRAFLINLIVMLAFVALSYATGTQHYTYDHYRIGLVGWVAVDNCQSAIVCLIVPLLLYYSYKTSKPLFAACAAVCFAQMFFIATRLAYCSIFLIAGGMIAALLINREKRPFYYGVLLLAILVFGACFKLSPMYQVRVLNGENTSQRQSWAEISLQKSKEKLQAQGLDEDSILLYQDLYELYLPNMVEKFGLERTVDAYGYTTMTYELMDLRRQKNTFAKLIWEDSDTLTHLFGFEYSRMVYNDFVYDLENDFNAILYYYGYVGFALYLAFFLYFLALIVKSVWKDFRGTLTVEACAVGITFVLLVGAAQFSGNVLRRPNVSIFLSLILAYIYHLTVLQGGRPLFGGKGCRRIGQRD